MHDMNYGRLHVFFLFEWSSLSASVFCCCFLAGLLSRAGVLVTAARSTLPYCSPSKNDQEHRLSDVTGLDAAAHQPPVNQCSRSCALCSSTPPWKPFLFLMCVSLRRFASDNPSFPLYYLIYNL